MAYFNCMDKESITETLVDFIQSIGISVYFEDNTGQTFLPGITIKNGALIVDKAKLSHPGDLLHEAGHIAVTPGEERKLLDETNAAQFDDGNEIAAIAWSYAACKYLNIDPHIVFHENGYRGASENIITNFNNGQYMGAPLLDWHGMTTYGNHHQHSVSDTYPTMTYWLSQK